LGRAIGGGAQSGCVGGKLAGWGALAGVGRDRNWRRPGARRRLRSPRSLAVAGGRGSEAARSAGAAAVKAACGIAGFLAVYLTNKVGCAN
jgi:hypothetical protein